MRERLTHEKFFPVYWVSVALLILVSDYLTGPFIQFPILFLIPVALASWYNGRWWGCVLAISLPLVRIYFEITWPAPWRIQEAIVNAATYIIVLLAFVLLVDRTATQTRALRASEERFRLLVDGVKGYAIFMLDPQGYVVSWTAAAEQMKGYQAGEIIGQHFSIFYSPEDIERGEPSRELDVAMAKGRFEEEGWRVRKDGSRFWANVAITVLRDETGKLRGFANTTWKVG